MVSKERHCGNCRHLKWTYERMGGDTWCKCVHPSWDSGASPLRIRVSEVWHTYCDDWEEEK